MQALSIIKYLELNTTGRDFVVGDIHGHFSLLYQSLEENGFDFAKDRLISVGDLVNKGPESEKSLSYLQESWFHAVSGNHDYDVTQFCKIVLDKGGFEDVQPDIDVYKAQWLQEDKNRKRLIEIYEALKILPIAIEVETSIGKVGIVHGEIPLKMTWSQFKKLLKEEFSAWKTGKFSRLKSRVLNGRERVRSQNFSDVDGVSRMFVGHTPFDTPQKLGNVFYVDMHVMKNGKLPLFELSASSEKIIQANKAPSFS